MLDGGTAVSCLQRKKKKKVDDVSKALVSVLQTLAADRKLPASLQNRGVRLIEALLLTKDWDEVRETVAAWLPAAASAYMPTLEEFNIMNTPGPLPPNVLELCKASEHSSFLAHCWNRLAVDITAGGARFPIPDVLAMLLTCFSRDGLSAAAQVAGTELLLAIRDTSAVETALAAGAGSAPALPTAPELAAVSADTLPALMAALNMCVTCPREGVIGACWDRVRRAPYAMPALQVTKCIVDTLRHKVDASEYLQELGSETVAGVAIVRYMADSLLALTACVDDLLAQPARCVGILHHLLSEWMQLAARACDGSSEACAALGRNPMLPTYVREALSPAALADTPRIATATFTLVKRACDGDRACLAAHTEDLATRPNWTSEEKRKLGKFNRGGDAPAVLAAAKQQHMALLLRSGVSFKQQLYYLGGHGSDMSETFTVPPGCTLVLTTLLGMSSSSTVGCRMRELFSHAGNRDLLIRMTLPQHREELKRRLQLPEAHNVHVYSSGAQAPNASYSPGNYSNMSGVMRFPIRSLHPELDFDNERPCARFAEGSSDETVHLPADVVYARFGQSLYPTAHEIFTATPKFRSTKDIHHSFATRLDDVLHKFGRGVYYFTACRSGAFTHAYKRMVEGSSAAGLAVSLDTMRTTPTAMVERAGGFDLSEAQRAELARLRDEAEAAAAAEAAYFARLPGMHRQTRAAAKRHKGEESTGDRPAWYL